VILAPLDKDEVLPAVAQGVGHPVLLVPFVSDMNLLTGRVGPVYAHEEHVVAALTAVHPEAVLTSQHGPFQSGSLCLTLGRVTAKLQRDGPAVAPGLRVGCLLPVHRLLLEEGVLDRLHRHTRALTSLLHVVTSSLARRA